MPFAILALTISAFGIGTTEFVMMGLLPVVAGDLHTSIPTAGHLISGYALGVVIGAPLLTALGVRMRRKTMLLSMMGLFTAGNLLSAFAPSHETLLVARVLSGLPHGAFFGIGAIVAASMVAKDRRARAISMMFVGLTVANIVGVPVGTLVGQTMGWRWTFGLVALIGLVSLLAITALVPKQDRQAGKNLRGELVAFRRPQVWLAFAIVVFGFGGTFACFTYVAPMITDVAGFAPVWVPLLTAVFGIGMTIGTVLGGRLADRAPMPTQYLALSALAVTLGLFVFTAHSKVLAPITLLLIGISAFTGIPSVQMRILDKAKEAPELASAGIQSAFNIANSIGASLGGLVIGAGLGFTSPNWVGAVLAVIGLGFATASGLLDRRIAAATAGRETRPADPELARSGTGE